MYSNTPLQLSKADIVQEIIKSEIETDWSFTQVKIKAKLINNTELNIREKTTAHSFRYAYHWQDNQGNLIKRWDNAPHHFKIKTFPHHQHIKLNGLIKIIESDSMTISDVLLEIKQKIDKI